MLKLVVLVALVAAANGASCPAVCSTCFAGGAGGGISLVGGVCHASCSASGYCGTSDAYTNGGTDCTGCAETPTVSQRANLKLADAHFVTNTKASITAAELLYKQTVVEFSALFNAGSLLTKSAKMRYNYLLDLDSRKPAAEQALLCVDNCSPTGTWVPPANDPTGCPAGGIYAGMNYCTWASGVGSGSNPYSLCGQTHMDGGGGKCQKTCGTCADKTPYAASELSSLLGRRSNDQCSDGEQNGDETGVDCGGSCSVCPVDCVSSETTCTCTPACANTCDCTDTITITTPAAGRGQACPSATVRTFAGAACLPWTTVYQKGSYGSTDVGSASFFSTFKASPNKIAKRSCASCEATHKEVYYKRITNTGSYNPYSVLIDSWIQTDNTLGTDFELYSTYEDAIAGRNKWNYCNYCTSSTGYVAFPRDCGPTLYVGGQWATRYAGHAVEWSIEPAN